MNNETREVYNILTTIESIYYASIEDASRSLMAFVSGAEASCEAFYELADIDCHINFDIVQWNALYNYFRNQ